MKPVNPSSDPVLTIQSSGSLYADDLLLHSNYFHCDKPLVIREADFQDRKPLKSKSSHAMQTGNFEGKKFLLKSNKLGGAHFSVMEVIFTMLMARLLNSAEEQFVKSAHLVIDANAKIIGVAIEMHDDFTPFTEINLIELLNKASKRTDPGSLETILSPHLQTDDRKIEDYLYRNPEKRKKLVRNLYKISRGRYDCCDDDYHKGNIGFIAAKNEDGEIVDIRIVPIDFDLVLYDQIGSQFQTRNSQLGFVEDKFGFSDDPLATILKPPGLPPGFFPSVATDGWNAGRTGVLFTPNDGKYTADDVEHFKELFTRPQYKDVIDKAVVEAAQRFLELDCAEFSRELADFHPNKLSEKDIVLEDTVRINFVNITAAAVIKRQQQFEASIKDSDGMQIAEGAGHKQTLQAVVSAASSSRNRKTISIDPLILHVRLRSYDYDNLSTGRTDAYSSFAAIILILTEEASDIRERKVYLFGLLELFINNIHNTESFSQFVTWWKTLEIDKTTNIITFGDCDGFLYRHFTTPFFSPWTKSYVAMCDLLLAKGFELGHQGHDVTLEMEVLRDFSGPLKPRSCAPLGFGTRVRLNAERTFINRYVELTPSNYWQSKHGFEKILFPLSVIKDGVKSILIFLPMLGEEAARQTARFLYQGISSEHKLLSVAPLVLYGFARLIQYFFHVIQRIIHRIFSPLISAQNAYAWGERNYSVTTARVLYVTSLVISTLLYVGIAKAALAALPIIGLTVIAKGLMAFVQLIGPVKLASVSLGLTAVTAIGAQAVSEGIEMSCRGKKLTLPRTISALFAKPTPYHADTEKRSHVVNPFR